jgi:hypothetical protein
MLCPSFCGRGGLYTYTAAALVLYSREGWKFLDGFAGVFLF